MGPLRGAGGASAGARSHGRRKPVTRLKQPVRNMEPGEPEYPGLGAPDGRSASPMPVSAPPGGADETDGEHCTQGPLRVR